MQDLLLDLDYRLFHFFNGFAGKNSLLDTLFVILAEEIILVLIAGFVILLLRARRKWMHLIAPIISGLLARFGFASLIRAYFFRPRPFVTSIVSQLVYHDPLEASFPSGHAAFMFGVAFSLLFLSVPRRWKIVYLVAAFVSSVSRVIVGVHYPLDIFVGGLIGLLAAIVVKWIFEIFVNRAGKSKKQSGLTEK